MTLTLTHTFLPSSLSSLGQYAVSGLSAGPAQILTLSTTVSTTEGYFALARNGLSNFNNGFGYPQWSGGTPEIDDLYSKSVGLLSFEMSSTDEEIVQGVADILTAGRLSSDAITEVTNAVSQMNDNTVKNKLAQQLISTSPEFHTTNIVERTDDPRSPTPRQERLEEAGYKAVITLNLAGGWDGFNVLTPHTSCELYKSYRNNRRGVALGDREMLAISNDDPEQPCDTFGVHHEIPIFKELYDEGYGQFHANIGHLSKPVTKRNWYTETRTHLFSHTTMEREAQLVDAFQEDGWSTGVGGRMLDILMQHNQSVTAIGIGNKGPIVEGNPSTGRKVMVVPYENVNTVSSFSL